MSSHPCHSFWYIYSVSLTILIRTPFITIYLIPFYAKHYLNISSLQSTTMNDEEPVLRREIAYTGIPRNRVQRTFTDWANLQAFHQDQPPTSAFSRARQDVPPPFEYSRSPLQPSHTVNTPTASRAHTPYNGASSSGTKVSKPKATTDKENTEEHFVSPKRPDTPDPRHTMPTPVLHAPSPATESPNEQDHEDEEDIDERLEHVRKGLLGEMSPPGSINSKFAMKQSFRGSSTSLDEKYRGPCSSPVESVVDLIDYNNVDNDARPHWRMKFRGVFKAQVQNRERSRLRNLGIAVQQYFNQLPKE
jgi:hypothetical protein